MIGNARENYEICVNYDVINIVLWESKYQFNNYNNFNKNAFSKRHVVQNIQNMRYISAYESYISLLIRVAIKSYIVNKCNMWLLTERSRLLSIVHVTNKFYALKYWQESSMCFQKKRKNYKSNELEWCQDLFLEVFL